MNKISFVGTAAILIVAGCGLGPVRPQQPDPPPRATAEPTLLMPDFIRRYQADEGDVDRFWHVSWSEARRKRLAAFYQDWLDRLEALNYEALSPTDRVDYHLLHTNIRWKAKGVELEAKRLAEIDSVMPFRAAIQELELSRRRMEPCDPKASAATLDDAAEQVKKVRKRVEGGRLEEGKRPPDAIVLTAAQAQRAAGALDSLNGTIDSWAAFYDEFVPEFGWWTHKPRREAQDQIRDLSKYLREEVAGLKGKDEDPLVGDPIGRDGLLVDIEGEMLAYTPEELISIGEHELAWCEGELKKSAQKLGFGEDWKAALAKVKDDQMPPGEQAAFVRDESRASVKFLVDRSLVTIPPLCNETWRLEMHSPETQRVLPYAVYGGQHMGVSYAAESMSNADKLMSMRGNNRHFTHIVAPHELIPGHHLQLFIAERERPYREVFRTPFYVEGWALYWEMRYWDLGWAGATGQDPEMDRIGMLFWRMHRAARIIVSLKFHLGEMKPQEMVDFLVDRVGHERSGATAEVRRYIGGGYSPLYQCGYMIGGLQLRALRHDLVESGKMKDREFNDAVLRENSIPIEMVRADLTGQSLPRDWTPTWRFNQP
jgi:uncharacterized protein (DUF885 family)